MGGPVVMCWAPRVCLESRQSAQHCCMLCWRLADRGPAAEQQCQALTGGLNHRSCLLSSSALDGPHTCQGLPELNKPPWESQGDREQRAAASEAQECGPISHGMQGRLQAAPRAMPQLGS